MQEFTPTQYLKIDIANSYGLDKLKWQERIDWFDQNLPQLGSLIPQAKEPAMFYAGCKAYNDALEGKPSGYMVSLDATASGMQLLAAMTGCRKTAELCNVVSVGSGPEGTGAKRMDAYTVIYNAMLNVLGEEGKISRDDTKQAIMTSFYSSKAVPKKVFGEGALLDLFYDTMKAKAPGAWELNDAMLSMWQPDTLAHEWVLPDNFHVKVKVMASVTETVHFRNQPFEIYFQENIPQDTGRSLSANCTHSVDGMVVREVTRRCDYDINMVNELYNLLAENHEDLADRQRHDREDDKLVMILWDHYQKSGYLSARILQHLNAENIGHVDCAVIWELLNSLPEKPFKVLSIHDAFRCHPNYANDLRRQYINQLALIAKSNLLSFMASQIMGRHIIINKLDDNLWQDVLDAEYALS